MMTAKVAYDAEGKKISINVDDDRQGDLMNSKFPLQPVHHLQHNEQQHH